MRSRRYGATAQFSSCQRCAMDLSFSAAEEAFRTELRAWLGANLPRPAPEPETLADEVAYLIDWQRRLAAGRWVGVHWPREYGGRGASVVENYLFQEEMASEQAPEIIGRIGVNRSEEHTSELQSLRQ